MFGRGRARVRARKRRPRPTTQTGDQCRDRFPASVISLTGPVGPDGRRQPKTGDVHAETACPKALAFRTGVSMTGSKTVTVVSIVALVAIAAPAAPQAPDGPVPVQHVSGKSRAEFTNLKPPICAKQPRPRPWTDRLRAGAASIRAIHFLELRTRIAALRDRTGLPPLQWTDPVLTPGVAGEHSRNLRGTATPDDRLSPAAASGSSPFESRRCRDAKGASCNVRTVRSA